MAMIRIHGGMDVKRPASEQQSPEAGVLGAEQPLIDAENRTEWQDAQERVLLYLKLLGIAPGKSLDVARKVLDQAVQAAGETDAAPGQTAALSMRALQAILTSEPDLLEQTPFAAYPSLYRRWRPEEDTSSLAVPPEENGTADIAATPPIQRGFMRTKGL